VLSGTVGFITDGGEEKILNQHDVIVCRGAILASIHPFVVRATADNDIVLIQNLFFTSVCNESDLSQKMGRDWRRHLQATFMIPRKRKTRLSETDLG
jgi:hypothetical protein